MKLGSGKTNESEWTENYDQYFDVMISSNDCVDGKPSPECYLKAADNLGVEPVNCIVFEDSFAGISAARSSGMIVVEVSSSHSKNELMSECKNVVGDFQRIGLK
ncbi:HAD family phosphatase [Chryseobacterium sp. CY353]|nr:HAD family phosphatase [Chryseobacterium sp. CY353]